ncbi:MAG: hypothetical protein JNL40_12355 [Cyclobacteriaceae bacterium]|nr:hypothetical protein [Cyclobacteriaceae bacterium]
MKLTDQVLKDQKCTVRLWVKVPYNAKGFSPIMGVCLSPEKVVVDKIQNLEFAATVEFSADWSPGKWVLLEAEFVAQENSQYLIIGNFNPNSETKYVSLTNANPDQVSFLFVDDVELSIR